MSAITADQVQPPERRFRLVHLAAIFRPMVLDLVATLAFAGLYAATGNLWISTGVGVVAGIGQVVWRLATRRQVGALQWAGLGLVIVTASIALVTHSPLVVMLKPTLIYAVIGAAMLRRGWMIRYAPPFERTPIPPSAYDLAGFGLAAFMLLSAVLNLVIALGADAKTWAAFISIYATISKPASFGLVTLYFSLIARHNKRRGRFFQMPAAASAPSLV